MADRQPNNVNNSNLPRGRKHPQQVLSNFFNGRLLPNEVGALYQLLPTLVPCGHRNDALDEDPNRAYATYAAARQACVETVSRIGQECRANNEQFADRSFDIHADRLRRSSEMDYLQGLKSVDEQGKCMPDPSDVPGSVHRVGWIFEDPRLFAGAPKQHIPDLGHGPHDSSYGYRSCNHKKSWFRTLLGLPCKRCSAGEMFSHEDVIQGSMGNCGWLAGLVALCRHQELLRKVLVAWDQACGVYGYVFYRDGRYIYTVVDDYLYLRKVDYRSSGLKSYDPTLEKENEYKYGYQTGSEALYFSRCKDDNLTWLPLLEKACAKVHGDYAALEGGLASEGVENLTGGIATQLRTNSILDKDHLWKQIFDAKSKYVFSVISPKRSSYDPHPTGIAPSHAFSIIKAYEEYAEDKKTLVRLVRVRNPWGQKSRYGQGDWDGPWSEGSPEWNVYWLKKLDHKFRNDGTFFMTFDDMLSKFDIIERTQLFDENWTVKQKWTQVRVPWVPKNNRARFIVTITEPGEVFFVLSQADTRYFLGLEGRYTFHLDFEIYTIEPENRYRRILSPIGPGRLYDPRSISASAHLQPGNYAVLLKIEAKYRRGRLHNGKRAAALSAEDIVILEASKRPSKVQQLAGNYEWVLHRIRTQAADDVLQQDLAQQALEQSSGSNDGAALTSDDDDHLQGAPASLSGRFPLSRSASRTSIYHDAMEYADRNAGDESNKACDHDHIEHMPEHTEHVNADPAARVEHAQVSGDRVCRDPRNAPWNPNCIVGLRVYCKDPNVEIEVQGVQECSQGRPKPTEDGPGDAEVQTA